MPALARDPPRVRRLLPDDADAFHALRLEGFARHREQISGEVTVQGTLSVIKRLQHLHQSVVAKAIIWDN